MAEPIGSDIDDDAAGRRRRGLLIALVVFVVGTIGIVSTEVSDWMADRRAEQLGDELLDASAAIDLGGLSAGDQVLAWEDAGPNSYVEILGHDGSYAGGTFEPGNLRFWYRTSWGLSTRCVRLTVGTDYRGVATTDSGRCGPTFGP